jgi:hypothetical protein
MNTEIPPTVTPDVLTKILHARADSKPRAKIDAAIPQEPVPYDLRTHIELPKLTLQRLTRNKSGEKFWLPAILEAAREGLFAAQVEAARAAEVAEFLAKVENTAAELDAIREEMHG